MKANRDWKRLLKRIGIGFVVLAAFLLLTNAILNWRAGTRLEARLRRLRAAKAPTSIRELAPQEIRDETNAAAVLGNTNEQLREFDRDYEAFLNTPVGKAYYERRDQGELPTLEQTEEMEVILARYDEVMVLLRQAAQQQQYASLLDFSVDQDGFLQELIDAVSSVKSAARLLMLRMQASAARGDANAAVSTGIDLLRLSRFYEQEPALISYLVAISCRQIACRELNHAVRQETLAAEMRDQLDAELNQQTGLSGLQKSLRAARAIGLDAMAEWRHGGPGKVLGWRITNWQSDLIDYYDALLPVLATPWHVGHYKLKLPLVDYPIVVQHLLPTLQLSYDAANRDIATQRCLRVLNELRRYQTEHDKEANGLSDLSIPGEESLDPFSGKPLIVRQSEDGWVVYSVFKNGQDDGGSFEELLDWGLSP